ncbi:hypothetical protein TESG_04045 [Trichophyton tonsurans CBS 112818]|uniref:Squalene/phytoene synthase n=2 Tax=Trichophyton TaxID=5550 RepID=F2Q098_TRIEC|nr:hypothetical protein TESG_04045 [Trichophyton tonsurans CBS 112818]EGE07598.1 hypothetical protein TEQG_06512 [Trichophyton equinum CBS 127.97]
MASNYSMCIQCTLRYARSQIFRPVPIKKQSIRSLSISAPCLTASNRPGSSNAELESAHNYCVELLRKYDRPSYTLSTFIPRHSTKFYIALHALNVSLSMIPETTSAHTIGLMRLQYWRDAITRTLAGTPPKEPIAILLASALSDLDARTQGRAKISKGWLMRLINAREQHLAHTPYPTLASLESYAESTYSTLLYLTLSALPLTSLTADHLASHIGKAAGITALLRGVPLVAFPPPPSHHSSQTRMGNEGPIAGDSRQGSIMLPLDVMAQTGVKEEDVFRLGADAPGLRDAVFTVATRASDHLITARQMLKNLRAGQDVGHAFEHEGEEGHEYQDDQHEKSTSLSTQLREVERGFCVLLPAVSTSLWLNKLQKVDFDIFKPELLSTDWRLPWKAYWAYRQRNI